MEGLSTALRNVLKPVQASDFDDLLAKIDENVQAATVVKEVSHRLDDTLCGKCGPNKPRLKQLKRRLAAV